MKSVRCRRTALLLAGFTFAGCSHFGHQPSTSILHYQCGTLPLTVTLKQDSHPPEVHFLLDGERLQLPQVISASGTRYSNGRYTFWSKGDHAFVQRGEQVIVDDCVLTSQPSG